LTIIGRERNRKNVVGVAYEAACGDTGCEFPEAEGLIPGCGEGVGTVGRNDLKRTVNFPYILKLRDWGCTQSETMWE